MDASTLLDARRSTSTRAYRAQRLICGPEDSGTDQAADLVDRDAEDLGRLVQGDRLSQGRHVVEAVAAVLVTSTVGRTATSA